jgi:hypothetical protein
MNIDLANFDANALGLGPNFDIVTRVALAELDKKETVSDVTISWLINPPPVYAAAETDEFKKYQKQREEQYINEKEKSVRMVKTIKKEFYLFLCTDSKKHSKERDAIGGNINSVVAILTASIVATHGIPAGAVTAVVALLCLVAGRVGISAYCKVYNPKHKK